jgi:PAS domain S-box-containing protein
MIGRDPSGAETWLLSLPPTRRQTRWVIAIALCQVAALALLAPFASIPLVQINGFVPAVGGVIFVADLVTAVLLFSQFATHRRRALLILACGYLLSALMVMAYTLTFPGAFSPTGLLGAGLQTTAWLYWSWHLPFALVLLGYGLIRDEKSEPGPAQASSIAVIVRSVALVVVLASGLTLLTTAGHDYLPVLFAGTVNRVRPLPTQGIAPITTLVFVSAFAALWLRRRRSLLDRWLMVVALAAILEIGLTVLLSNRRFDLGFYAGRVFSLLTSTIVLVVLLVETMRLYANLRELNETLEQRVQAETRERLQIWNVSQDLLVIGSGGKFLSINPAWSATFGWSESDLLGEAYQRILHPDDQERTRSEFDHLFRGGKTLHFESRLRAKNGAYHWVSWAVATDGGRVYGMGRDITEQKRAQEALRRSEQGLRSAIDGIPGFVGILTPNGDIETLNRQILEYSGQSLEEIKNWGTNGTVHHEDVPHVAEVQTRSFASGVPFQYEARLRRHDGQYRWFDNRGIPVRDDSGRIVRWYVLLTDIEDRTQALARLQKMQSDFARVNRVSMMGELAASLSHEIAQPIASARNNARAAQNFLKLQPPDLGEVREALSCVVGDADRAGDIIDRIREQVKKAPPRKQPFDLNAAIDEVIVLARSVTLRNGVLVQTRLAEGLLSVLGDRVQVQQVLLNLVLNAAEAMGSVEEGARELVISTEDHLAGALVVVRDSGPGIGPAYLDRVFDAFYTTKPSGTGMGLAICRSIIDAHGGQLWAEANDPRGAAFHFTLPDAGRELTTPPQASQPT